MTEQEVFSKSRAHVIKQGRPSIEESKSSYSGSRAYSCRYRRVAEDGKILKCGIGCFIPKKWYNPVVEDLNINSDIVRNRLPDEILEYGDLLDALQLAHDIAAEESRYGQDFITVYMKRIASVAVEFNLENA